MVITHHGACLCVAGGERCHFSCCLINERQEEREIKSCGRHDALGKAITVIGEIAGEDGGKMETAAAFGRKVDYACGTDDANAWTTSEERASEDSTKQGMTEKSTSRPLVNVCIG